VTLNKRAGVEEKRQIVAPNHRFIRRCSLTHTYFGKVEFISAALSTQLKSVRTTIQPIRNLESDCKMMVGGMAFGDAPEIWGQVGADGYASTLSKALETGNELVKS